MTLSQTFYGIKKNMMNLSGKIKLGLVIALASVGFSAGAASPGSQEEPWICNDDGTVTAYTNGLGRLTIQGSGFIQDAVVYQAAIRPDGTLYTIPAISLPGYKAVLYGTNDLSDPSGWRRVDQGRTMEETGYRFFQIRLEK